LPNEIISGLPSFNDLRDTELCHEMSKFGKNTTPNMPDYKHNIVKGWVGS